MLMKPEHRQLVLLVGFMTLLAVTVLFVFVYAPNALDVVYPDLPSLGELAKIILEKFNLFNYL